MRLEHRLNEWWINPTGPTLNTRPPARYRYIDPLSGAELPSKTVRTAAFVPSRKWTPYNQLQGVDSGYFTELYSLNEIAVRYGLSGNGSIYFKNHILPKPFDIVRRRSVSAHHWSRLTLMVLDVVMQDLEKRGILQFLKRFNDHVNLVSIGTDYLTEYHARKFDRLAINPNDRFGVQWYDR